MQYSVVNFQNVINNPILRLEAEFYISDSKSLELTGAEIIDFVQYGTSKDLNEEKKGYPTLRLNEFNGLFVGKPSKYCNLINPETFDALKLKKGDVLICRTNGNPKLVGRSAIVQRDFDYAFASYLFRIRPKLNLINSETLCAYLNSKIGRGQIDKYSMVSNQANFSPAKFREIAIPKFQSLIQAKIKSLFEESSQLKGSSDILYTQAESILLKELGLEGWKPKHQLSYIKNFSDTSNANRIDAEYFQPQYEEIEKALTSYKNGYSFVKNEFEYIKTTFNTEPKKTYNYVEIGSISVSNGEITPEIVLGSELPDNAKRKLSKGQIIISKVRTYRGAITIVDSNDYVGSGAFTVLEEKKNSKVNKETLMMLLKSKPLLTWSLKPNTGTSYPVIIDEDILNLPLPIISTDIQNKIKENVIESGLMRAKSKALLETAKKAVEMAIEQSEEKATKWIDEELKKLGVTL